MIGQWVRIQDKLVMDELGWHRVREAVEIQGDVDRRWRLDLRCHVVILVNPKTLERGLPSAGARICSVCPKKEVV